MENFLERLRQKPEHKKQRFAFLTAFVITAFIFAFWASTLNSRITNISKGQKRVVSPITAVSENAASALEGFESFKKTITGFFQKKTTNNLELELVE